MTTEILPGVQEEFPDPDDPATSESGLAETARAEYGDDKEAIGSSLPKELRQLLMPLASLKFTVALFVMAIIIVLAGTFAQWDKDINQVIDQYFRVKFPAHGGFLDYFRALFVRIDFYIFFPPSFTSNPPQLEGGLYFPKGWLIGALMAVNLLAAHALRFKLQAKGTRLLAGLGVIAAGVLATWLVIGSGSSADGLQTEPLISWDTLWTICSYLVKFGLIAGALGLAFAAHKNWDRRPLFRWLLLSAGILLAVLDLWLISKGEAATLNGSSMRILWLLVKATFSSLILLAGCILAFRKRAGIVLLHAGVGLIMFNELLVGTTHREAQMILEEGETVNYVQNINATEIAIIDRSDAKEDSVVAVPLSRLDQEKKLTESQLPFHIQLIELIPNARLKQPKAGEKNLATIGNGKHFVAEQIASGTGTDVGGSVDLPAVYVKLTGKDGEDLGTRLLALELTLGKLDEQIEVEIPGQPGKKKTYDVALRFEREYKPYSIHLIDLHKDDYVGTTTVKNYESDIRLVDASRNVDRELSIWMNNPLRFAGETFYQSNYHFDPRTGVETTTFQVVENNGWMIPYVSCMIVVVGMLAQFGTTLLRFLRRREQEELAPDPAQRIQNLKGVNVREKSKAAIARLAGNRPETVGDWVFLLYPFAIAATVAFWLMTTLVSWNFNSTEMDLAEFGRLPLAYEGRIKPFDTLARTSLRQISGKQTTKDPNGKTVSATRWLLELVTNTRSALQYKVFKIDNPDVLQTLGLQRRAGYLYSYEEFAPKFDEFLRQTRMAHEQQEKDKNSLSVYQRKLIETEKRIGIVDLLLESLRRPEMTQEDLLRTAQRAPQLLQRQPPLVIPPLTEEEKKENRWQALPIAALMGIMQEQMSDQKMPETTSGLLAIFEAYQEGKPGSFNAAVADYRATLEKDPQLAQELAHTQYEARFNKAEPFYSAMLIYGFAFLVSVVALLGWGKLLNRTAFWMMVVTLLYHTWALYARMEISGRPPVTNLYSSAIFIGWGCVVLGLVIESIYRIGIGNMIAAATGFGSLLVAHLLTTSVPDHMGDTFIVMQAVLDTQFWLATHVVCVTLGYATTFVAGFLGILYVLLGLCTPLYRTIQDMPKIIARMIYGTICFALVFSFFGTVLGGLWADDSWGRFWGWDPKENGALIIVLWNALVLHARWDGMVKDRGLAVLAIGGNIATAWSWFGVNELGVGMHSYGFTDGVLLVLLWFGISQLMIITLGVIPKNYWWGFSSKLATTPARKKRR